MLRRKNPRLLLLTLALLLGQWLVLAHGFEHPAVQADAVCQICAHAQGLDSGALAPSAFGLPPSLPVEAALALRPTWPRIAPPRLAHSIRGPPAPANRFA